MFMSSPFGLVAGLLCAAALVPALVGGKFRRRIGFLIGGLYVAYLVIMFTCFGA